jgi:hypothetical protein
LKCLNFSAQQKNKRQQSIDTSASSKAPRPKSRLFDTSLVVTFILSFRESYRRPDSACPREIESVEGDKNVEVRAGRIRIDIPHPEQYGHRDASVMTGSIESSAFDVSKEGLFRSFEQQGPGKYRLHAHVMTGEIDLRGSH